METIQKSCEIFAAPHSTFPAFLTGSSNSMHPRQGVIDLDFAQPTPPSLSTELAISHPPIILPASPTMTQVLQSPPIITGAAGVAPAAITTSSTNISELPMVEQFPQEIIEDAR
jgi:hypothetical protein